jgi:hypothetical protein
MQMRNRSQGRSQQQQPKRIAPGAASRSRPAVDRVDRTRNNKRNRSEASTNSTTTSTSVITTSTASTAAAALHASHTQPDDSAVSSARKRPLSEQQRQPSTPPPSTSSTSTASSSLDFDPVRTVSVIDTPDKCALLHFRHRYLLDISQQSIVTVISRSTERS